MRWPIPDLLRKCLPSKNIFVAGMQNEKTWFSKANISANKNFLGNLFATSFRNALDLHFATTVTRWTWGQEMNKRDERARWTGPQQVRRWTSEMKARDEPDHGRSGDEPAISTARWRGCEMEMVFFKVRICEMNRVARWTCPTRLRDGGGARWKRFFWKFNFARWTGFRLARWTCPLRLRDGGCARWKWFFESSNLRDEPDHGRSGDKPARWTVANIF